MAVARVDVEFFEGFFDAGIGAEKVVLFQGKLDVMVRELLGKAGEMIVATGAFEGLEVVIFGKLERIAQNSILDESAA